MIYSLHKMQLFLSHFKYKLNKKNKKKNAISI